MKHKKLSIYLQKQAKSIKKKSSLFGVLLFSFLFIALFFITRGATPLSSELTYIEHSTLGESAGSVVPASCNSADPMSNMYLGSNGLYDHSGSHFYGDCTTACPAGSNGGVYDPYYNPTSSDCKKTCWDSSIISFTATCPVRPTTTCWDGSVITPSLGQSCPAHAYCGDSLATYSMDSQCTCTTARPNKIQFKTYPMYWCEPNTPTVNIYFSFFDSIINKVFAINN